MKVEGTQALRALAVACSAAVWLGSGSSAAAQSCPAAAPTQTIKIYNDSPVYLFPEIEVGLGTPDVWMQAECKVPNSQIGVLTYGQDKTFRFYVNPLTGIAPNASVSITVPLFTQLVATVDPTKPNQFAEWWQGQNIQIFTSPTPTPPLALANAYNGVTRPKQKPLVSAAASPVWPTCAYTPPPASPSAPPPPSTPCLLPFVSDTDGTMPKNGPSQLFEATLGARQAQPVVNDSPPNTLDETNADFDVSYVNVAYIAGAMGPYKNDQTGYIGSPMKPVDFAAKLNAFQQVTNWPKFQSTDPNIPAGQRDVQKLPSPLELIARLSGANPPADLPPVESWPTKVWASVQALRDNWNQWSQACMHSATNDQFCDAILDVRDLIDANYQSYVALFKSGRCTGTMVQKTPDRVLAHLYGWTPWVEAVEDRMGCAPTDNLLENTSDYYKNNDYAQYSRVKLEFDNLNYQNFKPGQQPKYVFNPWVSFLHSGAKYLQIPNVYAYSVDDAVGNLQAEAQGFIIDVGSLKHLENQLPAKPPINVSLGYAQTDAVRFVSYRLCRNDPSRDTKVNPLNPAFILSASDPANCPVFLIDNKPTPQTYTFTLTTPPPYTQFTAAQDKAGLPRWSNKPPYDTTHDVDCSGDGNGPPFKPSSKAWCCSKTNSRGVFAYTVPDPHSAHQALVHHVVTLPALPYDTDQEITCSKGR